MKRRLYIDFETRSELDLKEVSTDRYVRDPSTRVLLTGWAVDDGPIVVEEGEYLPPALLALLGDPLVQKIAFNCTFEIAVLQHRFGVGVHYSEWLDVMVLGKYLGFPGKLAQLSAALGLEVQKDKRGTQLKTKFCGPTKVRKKKAPKPKPGNKTSDPLIPSMEPPEEIPDLPDTTAPAFYWRDATTDPDDWRSFKKYNHDDIAAMRGSLLKLETYPAMPQSEWNYWRLHEQIGMVGIPIDPVYVANASTIMAEADRKTRADLMALTGIKNLNSTPQWKDWLGGQESPMESIDEDHVDQALLGILPPVVRTVLELRQKLSGAGVKKLPKIQAQVSEDGRLRNQIAFYGASTGRFSGRGVQPHNLPRPDRSVKDMIGEITDSIRAGSILAGVDVATAVTSTIRSAFRAFDGFQIIQADYSSIEPRVLAWLSGCPALLAVFREGRDIYQDCAARFYGIPYEQVTRQQRNDLKAVVLGGGYGMGWERLIAYALTMGITLTKNQAVEHIAGFRRAYPEIPILWATVERTAFAAVRDHALYVLSHGVVFDGRDERFLRVGLPAGRSLFYQHAKVAKVQTKFGLKDRICFMAPRAGGGPMVPDETRGPILVENLVQAISRDILCLGLLRAHREKFTVFLHIHDEILAMQPIDSPLGKDALVNLMKRPPVWAPDLMLAAEGKVAVFYQK
jgi:DNA polymerase bacteriophage-type